MTNVYGFLFLNRLNGLAMINILREVETTIDEVIEVLKNTR